MTERFPELAESDLKTEKKKTRWSYDKTIIELGYRKISWFVSVSQINYLPQFDDAKKLAM